MFALKSADRTGAGFNETGKVTTPERSLSMAATIAESPNDEDTMGEVRVQVKLINAVDEVLARKGALGTQQVRSYQADALVDSGAIRTVIPSHVLQALGLEISRNQVAEYADGRKDVVGLSEPIKIEIMGRDTVDEALVLGDEVLIGQTVIEKLDLLIDCARRRLVPNPAHPDQPVSKVK